jgi:hypothetical protein
MSLSDQIDLAREILDSDRVRPPIATRLRGNPHGYKQRRVSQIVGGGGRMKLVAVKLWAGVRALVAAAVIVVGLIEADAAGAAAQHLNINCAESALCTEVGNSADVFGGGFIRSTQHDGVSC